MAWSTATMRLVDEVALQSSEELARIIGTRLKRNAPYASEFRTSALEILHELWPPEDIADTHTYLNAVGRDIDRMSADLLEDLSAALMTHAKTQRASNAPASGAANLIAGWLKVRCVETRSNGVMKQQAMRLKAAHTVLFKEVLSEEETAQTELAV